MWRILAGLRLLQMSLGASRAVICRQPIR